MNIYKLIYFRKYGSNIFNRKNELMYVNNAPPIKVQTTAPTKTVVILKNVATIHTPVIIITIKAKPSLDIGINNPFFNILTVVFLNFATNGNIKTTSII